MTTSEQRTDFLDEIPEPERQRLQTETEIFVVQHASHHRPIALVTSGGTAADLEVNSVRCLDNFSTGLRGAISVEQFLARGYAVIHLQREGSASPYARVLTTQLMGLKQANFGLSAASFGRLFAAGDMEEDTQDQLVQSVLSSEQYDPFMTDPNSPSSSNGQASSSSVNNGSKKRKNASSSTSSVELHRKITNSSRLQSAIKERAAVLKENRLLTISFRSVEEYLAKLQLCAQALQDSQSLAILYLAAAVSDFYIPKEERSEHKIQSADGSLTLQLQQVPKVMGLLRETWAPDAFLCSFKLETDKQILRSKAERAVKKYGSHLVIGNLLHTRHSQVWMLAPEERIESDTAPPVEEWPLQELSKPHDSEPDALESLIVDFVVQSHFEYISTSGCFGKDGTDAAIKAHEELEEKRRQIQRDLFWGRVKSTAMEWAGVAVGCFLSYAVSSALRKRMQI